MKYFLLGLIKVYQMIPGSFHGLCNHTPTCSQYAIESIIEYGSLKGMIMSIKRILKCNPLNRGYDPVVKKGNKN